MTILSINPNTRLSYDNLPTEVFQYFSSGMRHNNEGGPMFEVPENSVELVVNSIRNGIPNLDQGQSTIVDRSGNIINIHLTQPTQRPEERQATQIYQPTPTPPPTLNSEPEEGDGRCIAAPALPNIERIDGSEQQMIAITMQDNISLEAKRLSDLLKEINKLDTKAIGLKREASIIRGGIENNPLITSMINAIEELKNNDNLIDDIFLTKGFIVMRTKELITDNEINEKRRIIGRMQVKIDLRPLISSATSVEHPIDIKNIDRVYSEDGDIWHCGHVMENDICWGNMHEQMINAFEARDISALSEIIIRFIKNPNPTDVWGEHLKYWPEAN